MCLGKNNGLVSLTPPVNGASAFPDPKQCQHFLHRCHHITRSAISRHWSLGLALPPPGCLSWAFLRRTGCTAQGHLTSKNRAPLRPCSRLRLGPFSGPGGGALFYERATPVAVLQPGCTYWSYWGFNEHSTSATDVGVSFSGFSQLDALCVRYRGTSLTRKRTTLGPYRTPMLRVLGGSWGGGRFFYGRGTPEQIWQLWSGKQSGGSRLLRPNRLLQGYLAHKKSPTPLEPP